MLFVSIYDFFYLLLIFVADYGHSLKQMFAPGFLCVASTFASEPHPFKITMKFNVFHVFIANVFLMHFYSNRVSFHILYALHMFSVFFGLILELRL